MRSVINKFVAFQVGICTWKWDESSKRYKYRPFSFYVWPKSKVKDRSMMFQVSVNSNSLLLQAFFWTFLGNFLVIFPTIFPYEFFGSSSVDLNFFFVCSLVQYNSWSKITSISTSFSKKALIMVDTLRKIASVSYPDKKLITNSSLLDRTPSWVKLIKRNLLKWWRR